MSFIALLKRKKWFSFLCCSRNLRPIRTAVLMATACQPLV